MNPHPRPIDLYLQMHYSMYDIRFRWSETKNEELLRARGVEFKEVLEAEVITGQDHPGRSNQSLLLFDFRDYVWVVPCVIRGDEVFLKTAYPSRKYTKRWRAGRLT